MQIPASASTYKFTPACLKDIDEPPVFVIRHGTWEDKQELGYVTQGEGLRSYSTDQIRQITLEELRIGWDSEDIEKVVDLIERYWQAQDDLGEAQRDWLQQCAEITAQAKEDDVDAGELKFPDDPELEFEPGDKVYVENVLDQVMRISRRLHGIEADGAKYTQQLPRIMFRMLLRSHNLPGIRLVREGGLVSRRHCEEILTTLDNLCRANDIEEYGLAATQLLAEAAKSLLLDKSAEKNSSAPPSKDTARRRSGGKGASTSKTGGKSKNRKGK